MQYIITENQNISFEHFKTCNDELRVNYIFFNKKFALSRAITENYIFIKLYLANEKLFNLSKITKETVPEMEILLAN